MKVFEVSKPGRKPWEMSEEGFAELLRKFPGKYQKIQQPKVVVVEKKRVDVPVVKSKKKSARLG